MTVAALLTTEPRLTGYVQQRIKSSTCALLNLLPMESAKPEKLLSLSKEITKKLDPPIPLVVNDDYSLPPFVAKESSLLSWSSSSSCSCSSSIERRARATVSRVILTFRSRLYHDDDDDTLFQSAVFSVLVFFVAFPFGCPFSVEEHSKSTRSSIQ